MQILIENDELIKDQITSRKNGQVFYTAEQNALMFTEGSQYPHHFKIRLAFEDNPQKRDAVGPIAKGRYVLSDGAYIVSRFGELQLQVTAKTLKPLAAAPASAIPNRTAA